MTTIDGIDFNERVKWREIGKELERKRVLEIVKQMLKEGVKGNCMNNYRVIYKYNKITLHELRKRIEEGR